MSFREMLREANQAPLSAKQREKHALRIAKQESEAKSQHGYNLLAAQALRGSGVLLPSEANALRGGLAEIKDGKMILTQEDKAPHDDQFHVPDVEPAVTSSKDSEKLAA